MKSTRKKKKIGSCKTAKKTLKFQCTVYSILWIAQENIYIGYGSKYDFKTKSNQKSREKNMC